MKKKLDKIQFVIEILANIDKQRSCYFCKYNVKNYDGLTTEFMSFCSDKCKFCESFIAFTNPKNKRPSCIRNEYKSLYDWEEEKNE
jgi:hypothetical protein